MGRRIPAKQYCFEYMDENAAMTMKNGKSPENEKAGKLPALKIVDPYFRGSDELGHRDGGVRHAVGEAPLVVVP
jgi:hypothetical protein